MNTLLTTLQKLDEARRPGGLSFPDLGVLSGLDTEQVPSEYRWDGLRRGGDPVHPYLIFQYTLDGWGVYEERGVAQRLAPGMAFTAIIPSAHVYALPSAASHWTFFWLILRHPYVVQRMIQTIKQVGAVLTFPPDAALLARATRLFEGACLGNWRDGWAQEQALLDFLMEYERFCHSRRYAAGPRERLLEEVRREVLQSPGLPLDVTLLAERRGMSRSHFSHHFKDTTGLPPAQFVAQVRFEEATRRLLETRDTLETIAQQTGFANANHFCKVFRRHIHLSPGEFRRQMR